MALQGPSAENESATSRFMGLLPFPSNVQRPSFSGLRGFFNSLFPFTLNARDRRELRAHARRLLPQQREQEITNRFRPISRPRSSPSLERQRILNILGHWSADDIQVEETTQATVHRRGSLGNLPQSSWTPDEVVINLESSQVEQANPLVRRAAGDAVTDGVDRNEIQNDDDNENGSEENIERLHEEILERYPETRELLKILWQYCLCLLIILIKLIYDRFASLLVLILFWVGFVISNKIVKRVIAQPERMTSRSALSLSTVFAAVPLGIFIFYHRVPYNFYYCAIMMPLDYELLNVGDLLWIVFITDHVIKLSTVLIKGVYTAISWVFVNQSQRGKHFQLLEVTSQLYRSVAPVQLWLSYLFDGYAGIQKIFGVFLSALYMVLKFTDIRTKLTFFVFSMKKFMEDMKYGITPTKEQLSETGNVCPICHDNFVSPTLLNCQHIFCEQCISRWFDRERTCPVCRTNIADDPKYRDGSTSHYIQFF